MAQPHSIEREPPKPTQQAPSRKASVGDITKAARYTLISLAQHSMGRLAIKYKHIGFAEPGPIAYATAKECRYGPRFAEFDRFSQAFVVSHETCHHVLGHIPTGAVLYKRDPKGFSFKGYNIACDAIINYALAALPEPSTSSSIIAHGVKKCQELGIVNWDELCREMRQLSEKSNTPLSPVFEMKPNALTSVDIYNAIMQSARRVADKRKRERTAPDWDAVSDTLSALMAAAQANPGIIFIERPIPLGSLDLYDALAGLVRSYTDSEDPADLDCDAALADWSNIEVPLTALLADGASNPLHLFPGPRHRHSAALYADCVRIINVFLGKANPGEQDGDSEGSGGGDGSPGEPDDVDGILDRLADDLNAHDDLREAIEQASKASTEDKLIRDAHAAQGALRQAQAGVGSGDAIMLLSSRPTLTKTPWRTLLRSIASNALISRMSVNPLRPSRRTVSAMYDMVRTDGQRSTGNSIVVMPRLQRNSKTKRCVFILDTSGSMWDPKTIADAINEMWTLCKLYHVDMTIIFADDEVADTVTIGEAHHLIATIEPKGGGGTSFIPALKAAEEYSPDLIVYYTDLCGSFPDKPPKAPVIWAHPKESASLKTPFGKRVQVGD